MCCEMWWVVPAAGTRSCCCDGGGMHEMMRGGGLKLCQGKVRLGISRDFFSGEVIMHWHREVWGAGGIALRGI